MNQQALAASSRCDHYGHMTNGSDVLRKILGNAPGSIRELAREAELSHGLLVAIRDGDRRMTTSTRAALVQALREWGETCTALAEELEASELEPGGRDDEA